MKRGPPPLHPGSPPLDPGLPSSQANPLGAPLPLTTRRPRAKPAPKPAQPPPKPAPTPAADNLPESVGLSRRVERKGNGKDDNENGDGKEGNEDADGKDNASAGSKGGGKDDGENWDGKDDNEDADGKNNASAGSKGGGKERASAGSKGGGKESASAGLKGGGKGDGEADGIRSAGGIPVALGQILLRLIGRCRPGTSRIAKIAKNSEEKEKEKSKRVKNPPNTPSKNGQLSSSKDEKSTESTSTGGSFGGLTSSKDEKSREGRSTEGSFGGLTSPKDEKSMEGGLVEASWFGESMTFRRLGELAKLGPLQRDREVLVDRLRAIALLTVPHRERHQKALVLSTQKPVLPRSEREGFCGFNCPMPDCFEHHFKDRPFSADSMPEWMFSQDPNDASDVCANPNCPLQDSAMGAQFVVSADYLRRQDRTFCPRCNVTLYCTAHCWDEHQRAHQKGQCAEFAGIVKQFRLTLGMLAESHERRPPHPSDHFVGTSVDDFMRTTFVMFGPLPITHLEEFRLESATVDLWQNQPPAVRDELIAFWTVEKFLESNFLPHVFIYTVLSKGLKEDFYSDSTVRAAAAASRHLNGNDLCCGCWQAKKLWHCNRCGLTTACGKCHPTMHLPHLCNVIANLVEHVLAAPNLDRFQFFPSLLA